MQDMTKRLTLNMSERDLTDLHQLARMSGSRAGILARQAVLLVLDNPQILLSNTLAESEHVHAYSERRRASEERKET